MGSILPFFLTRVFSSKIRRKPSHLCFFNTILSLCDRVLWYWVPMNLVCFFHYETLADVTSINVVHPKFYFGLNGLWMKCFLHGIDIPPRHLPLLVTDVGDDFARFFAQVNVSDHSLIIKADIFNANEARRVSASCWAFVYIWLQVSAFVCVRVSVLFLRPWNTLVRSFLSPIFKRFLTLFKIFM